MQFPNSALERATITVVVNLEGAPRSLRAAYVSSEPFTVETDNTWARSLAPETKLLFVVQSGTEIIKGTGRVIDNVESGQNWRIVVENVLWESVDRRRHSRKAVHLPVEYRVVEEDASGTRMERGSAMTMDLSVGGACLKADRLPNNGLLVDVSLSLNGFDATRALGVVVWVRPIAGEFGIEFLDYFADAKKVLGEFVEAAA